MYVFGLYIDVSLFWLENGVWYEGRRLPFLGFICIIDELSFQFGFLDWFSGEEYD